MEHVPFDIGAQAAEGAYRFLTDNFAPISLQAERARFSYYRHSDRPVQEGGMEARIVVDGLDGDVESLWDWIQHEPMLRGRLKIRLGPGPEDAMGLPTELAVLGASAGALTALARTISVWLINRRSDVTIRVIGPTGRQVTVSGKRVADPEQLLRTVLELEASSELTKDG